MTTVLDAPLTARTRPAPVQRCRAPRLRPARLVPDPPPGPVLVPAPPGVPRLPDHPDARPAVTRVLRIACEVLDGRRPPAQLAPHAAPSVLRYWRAAAGTRRCARPGSPPPARPSAARPTRSGRAHIDHPCDGAAEVAVVLEVDGRARALAARFDLIDGRWRWTAVRLG